MNEYNATDNVFEWRRLNGYPDPFDDDDDDDLIKIALASPDTIKAGTEENRLKLGDIILTQEAIAINRKVYGGLTKRVVLPAGARYKITYVDYDLYSVSPEDELQEDGRAYEERHFRLPKYPIHAETGEPLNWRSLVVGEEK